MDTTTRRKRYAQALDLTGKRRTCVRARDRSRGDGEAEQAEGDDRRDGHRPLRPSGFDDNPGDFDILRDAVVTTGLDAKLNGKRQLTVFAPSDQAFLDLTSAATETDAFDAVASLGLPAVKQVLKYHVAPGKRGAKQVVAAKRIPTLLKKAKITKRSGSAKLKDATGRKVEIVAPNAARASNGVIHVIGGVLLPFALWATTNDRSVTSSDDEQRPRGSHQAARGRCC